MIKDNLAVIYSRISSVCKALSVDPEEITLVGVTKYSDIDSVKEAIKSGVTHIGESRVEEAQVKFPELYGLNIPIVRHMIGHLQTRKVKSALECFDLIESVDSLKLACEIQRQAAKINRHVNVLIQVNVSQEEQKYGIAPNGVEELLKEIESLERVHVKGLMAMAPLTDDKERIRNCFKGLKEIFDSVKNKYPSNEKISMQYLSMGMSGDFEIALEEGANMVRIGSAIFNDG